MYRKNIIIEEMEIYDEEDLSSYEIERQRNIISNYEFMKSCGKFIFIFNRLYITHFQ